MKKFRFAMRKAYIMFLELYFPEASYIQTMHMFIKPPNSGCLLVLTCLYAFVCLHMHVYIYTLKQKIKSMEFVSRVSQQPLHTLLVLSLYRFSHCKLAQRGRG